MKRHKIALSMSGSMWKETVRFQTQLLHRHISSVADSSLLRTDCPLNPWEHLIDLAEYVCLSRNRNRWTSLKQVLRFRTARVRLKVDFHFDNSVPHNSRQRDSTTEYLHLEPVEQL
jgi:hypothetical protein